MMNITPTTGLLSNMDQQEIRPKYSFYFFLNSRSGDGEAAKLMQLALQRREILARLTHPIQMHFVDLFDPNATLNNYRQIRSQLQDYSKDVYVIVCGGDGTVSWVINAMAQQQIDIAAVIFGLLPIGTGNDLCRSLGWSSESFHVTRDNFVNQINTWLVATIAPYDLWQVTLQTHTNGTIYDIRSKQERALPSKVMTKLFTNYVGMGLDARIVYTMERKRTSWACINKVLYGLVGCINCFRPLKELYKKISIFTDKNHSERELSQPESLQEVDQSSKEVATHQNDLLSEGRIRLKKGYRGLVCLNCTSYMCGLRNIWTTKTEACRNSTYQWRPQTSNDGLVEFVAYKNQLNMALQRLVTSGAKVAQGSGPFEILMTQPEKGIETTYLQIDGESVRVDNLKAIEICKSKISEEGKIKILRPPERLMIE